MRVQDISLKFKGLFTIVVLATVGAAACGGGSMEDGGATESTTTETEAEAEAEAEAVTMPARVLFASPLDETDHPTELPLGVTFGVENFTVGAVPETVETPRGGTGHYHLGVNAECLPVGEIIPQAEPWIHLGDGSDGMELQLEGGSYRLSVQIGDDEHRTLEGLCETITIRMEDGI